MKLPENFQKQKEQLKAERQQELQEKVKSEQAKQAAHNKLQEKANTAAKNAIYKFVDSALHEFLVFDDQITELCGTQSYRAKLIFDGHEPIRVVVYVEFSYSTPTFKVRTEDMCFEIPSPSYGRDKNGYLRVDTYYKKDSKDLTEALYKAELAYLQREEMTKKLPEMNADTDKQNAEKKRQQRKEKYQKRIEDKVVQRLGELVYNFLQNQ